MSHKRNKKAAVMVSDGRMAVIARELQKDGLEVLACRTEADLAQMERRASEWDILLLPIRGIDEEGYSSIPGVRFAMGQVMDQLKPEALVVTGLQTEYLKKLERKILCYFEDEEVHRQNAKLTSEGILYLLLKETTKSIFSQTVDIVGFGCVGRAAHELLNALGIAHRLVDQESRKTDDGDEVMSLEEWKKLTPAQVIINLAPALIADCKTAASWPSETVFLDVASGALGADEQVKEKIHYVAAPPLPGLVAEESAGIMLAEYVRRQIPNME